MKRQSVQSLELNEGRLNTRMFKLVVASRKLRIWTSCGWRQVRIRLSQRFALSSIKPFVYHFRWALNYGQAQRTSKFRSYFQVAKKQIQTSFPRRQKNKDLNQAVVFGRQRGRVPLRLLKISGARSMFLMFAFLLRKLFLVLAFLVGTASRDRLPFVQTVSHDRRSCLQIRST